MRIAYVEDNLANLALVRRVARMGQHEVESYAEAETALVSLGQNPPDLILVDLQLAGQMDGLQLVSTLRQQGVQTPIVAVTAYAMLGDRERCLEAGCNAYLPKPLPVSELLALFETHDTGKSAARGEQTGG